MGAVEDSLKEKGIDLLAERIVELIDLISKKAPGFLIDQYKNGKLALSTGLPEYLSANYTKCETVRTLLKRDSPTLLEKVYEPHRFHINRNVIPESELHRDIGMNLQRTIVSGSAGSGKSVFLKRLFRKSIEDGITYYPVFFELRSMPPDGKTGLLESVYSSIVRYSENFTKKQFNFALKKGLFYLMIDALDEAPSAMRDLIDEEIMEIARKYPYCPIVLTSRPDDSFTSWEGFHIAHLLPFSQAQCESFIAKVDYPHEKKTEFLEFIKAGAYQKHQEFLSNPLLASMMLLTFDEYGDIPARKHVFYEKCFQVLLREHDSSKGKYRREFKSALNYENLEEVFTYFCVLSYLDRKFVLTKEEVKTYISDALQAIGVEGSPEAVCTDFVEAVTVLQRDGRYYEFTHRSFQEFFYAKFSVKDRDIPLVDKISEIREFGDSDGSVRMIADMDRTYFERDFLLPVALTICKDITNVDLSQSPDKLIGKFFARVGAKIPDNDIAADGHDSNNNEKLTIYFSVTHDESEYLARRLNLILLNFISEYNLEVEEDRLSDELPNERVLEIFKIKEIPKRRGDMEFNINHHNRKKMVSLGCSRYALTVQRELEALTLRLRQSALTRKSKLSDRIISKK